MPITAGQIAFGIDADHIETKTLTQAQAYLFASGAIDGGALSSFEIPNSAAPTVNADGEIAVDITLADFSHGILKYFGGEEMAVIAVPIAELSGLSNGDVLSYNSTADEFQFGAAAGGGLTIGGAVSGGGANRVLYEDGSQNLAASANLKFGATNLGLDITSPNAGDVTLIIRGAASQSGPYEQINSGDGTTIFRAMPNGNGGLWFDFGTGSYSGIGDGGIGVNPWIVKTAGAGQFAFDAASGDIVYRLVGGAMRFTNSSGDNSALVVENNRARFRQAMEVDEITAPSAPAADRVYLYAEDNGSGKTRLMALFSSGAAQQVAIQP